MMLGATAVTVKVPLLLVTLLTIFVTLQRNVAPLSKRTHAGVVYVAPVAPGIFAPPFCH